MIQHPAFSVEPWAVRETALHLDVLAQTVSVFALANGHIGLRGNLDEGEPSGLPGTYLNGFYELRPLPYAEADYGDPESGQALINVINGKVIRLLVDDEPFDVRYGELRAHERRLDLRAGVLERRAEWISPTQRPVRVSSVRLVSFAQRAVAAICYEVEAAEDRTPVVVQSELVATESLPGIRGDPRATAALSSPLCPVAADVRGERVVLVHQTRASGLLMAAGMIHVIDGPADTETVAEGAGDLGRVLITATLKSGQRLRLVKFLAYGWSSLRSAEALRDQVSAALAEARHTGWQGLLQAQREYLDDFWTRADVELEGDLEVQQAVRFGMFHALQAGARAEQRAIPAKGLTGPGYDGHTFWDTETFVLPLLTYTSPHAARDALRWRHATLDAARERARRLELAGAAFPWRTIHGEACSAYWPAGTAAFHINADIADAVLRYQAATGDEAFGRGPGLELLIETARLWCSLGHHDSSGRFRIDGVTGPDEYSALSANNVYTNLMAQRNLRAAADAAARYPRRAAALGVSPGEASAWHDAAEAMLIPYDEGRGVHPQAEAFTEHQAWDFERTSPEKYPLMLHFPYFQLYRKQVVKQADLVLAMHLRGDAFTCEQKARNFGYYERLTVRDSSLSACTQAVIAAEVGHLGLAYDYFAETTLIDLKDLQRNTRDGLHIASLAGAWTAAVAGFGGMRDHGGTLTFAPRLPQRLTGLTFRLCYRQRCIEVAVSRHHAAYKLLYGEPLTSSHHGQPITISPGKTLRRPIPAAPVREPPTQPAGRAPAPR
ncbi:MAG TPA: glycosyl hydrolase family 65 protein [Streptosporangiaceae bacterium]|nr:glycosyl hydrolase family 65 protein [Streptosporangiaceae bacterium]